MIPVFGEEADAVVRHTRRSVPPADLWPFWQETLSTSRALATAPSVTAVCSGLELIETSDLRFSGFGGDRIAAWLHRPAGDRPLRGVVVRYLGYGSGRGLPHQASFWATAGYAEFVMDTRGQGGAWGEVGSTPDPHGHGPSHPGFMTRGIQSRDDYFYRRVFTDAVLALDAVRMLLGDELPVLIQGASQGGGIALAAASLGDGVTALMTDVPFLCDFPTGVADATDGPYLDLVRYLGTHRWDAESVFETLAYFDAAVLCRRATAPALFSVALADPVCPPKSVYAAINAYGGPVSTRVYPYNGHEGGQFHQQAEQLRWTRDLLGGRETGGS